MLREILFEIKWKLFLLWYAYLIAYYTILLFFMAFWEDVKVLAGEIIELIYHRED